ncbi:biotin-dependent carboxyltransferase family protein [Paenibacillus sp. JSM ZJ436]|uniref:biotin-dependent carboxyltransferase family protein n=1 Tax=Paenibacillus sp. JSM ZJ436 TaxID=3376190 RepID=UPI0037948C4D
MSIHVHRPGLLTTIQDSGRYGFQQYGVVVSGPMDTFAHRAGNLLVGNPPGYAALEMTLLGPVLEFQDAALIAICGGDFRAHINGSPLPLWRPVYVPAGSTLTVDAPKRGCRGVLAISGGLDVPLVMNSRSTYLRAGLGGLKGRALRAGDVLPVGARDEAIEPLLTAILKGMDREAQFGTVSWRISETLLPKYEEYPVLRLLEGPELHWLEEESQRELFSGTFTLQPQSDRMGCRLAGKPLRLGISRELASVPVTFGTVQLPPDGHPIVLMADRQTTGGYPRAGQVITADLPLLAQGKPGCRVRFQRVTLQEAQELLLQAELRLRQLEQSIVLQFRR